MLRNWLLTNNPKKRTMSDSAKKLDESSTVEVPTKIFVPSSSEDQQQANEPHPQLHRKEIQRPNQSHRARRKYSEESIKLGFLIMMSVILNALFAPRSLQTRA